LPLDQQTQAWLKEIEQFGLPPIQEMSVKEAREAYTAMVRQYGPTPKPVAELRNLEIPVGGTRIGARLYRPQGNGPFPVLVYFHGGGFVLGDLEVSHGACTYLANRSHAVVVSVDYRLAPEHPFPTAVEDAMAAVTWVADNAVELDIDPERLAVGGDSAGANLAAVVAALARDKGAPGIFYQLLLYPATDASCQQPSHQENGKDYFLTTEMMRWFYSQYVQDESQLKDWRVSPLLIPDTTHLPPALVVTAEYDPLRDEGEAYANKLVAGGAWVICKRYLGQIHAFAVNLAGAIGEGRRALEQVGLQLRQAFRAGWDTRYW
jgi:acetyl esterase